MPSKKLQDSVHAAIIASVDSANSADRDFNGEQFANDASIVAINSISELAFAKVPGVGSLVSGALGIFLNAFWPGESLVMLLSRPPC